MLLFHQQCHQILSLSSRKRNKFPTFWAFDWCSSLHIEEIMAVCILKKSWQFAYWRNHGSLHIEEIMAACILKKSWQFAYWRNHGSLHIEEIMAVCILKKSWLFAYWRNHGGSKFWLILIHDGIINDIINTIVYRHDHIPMVHLPIKLSDHISNCFRVIMTNVLISFIREYRLTLSSCHDVIKDVTIMKYTFFGITFIWPFDIWYQIKAVLDILKFSKLTKLWCPGTLFCQKIHRKLNMSCREPKAFPTFWVFGQHSSLNDDGVMPIVSSHKSHDASIDMS